MLLAGFAFKIAAVPLHAYAGDVYQGAATPVTAFLAFVPKTSGFVAMIKVLSAVGGAALGAAAAGRPPALGPGRADHDRSATCWACSSSTSSACWPTARSPTAATCWSASPPWPGRRGLPNDPASAAQIQGLALGGVLFYLAAYGIMNAGAFGVLMLLPSRDTGDAGPDAATPAAATYRRDLRRPRRPGPTPRRPGPGDGRLLLQPDRHPADRRASSARST